MSPYVSVIMSAYNEPEEYLRKSIESVLNQTHTDFEFIIILDNPDNKKAKEVLKEYENNDNRIILLENEKNIGLAPSLNRGVKVARGKYIARMDADDIALPEMFEKLLCFLENNPDYAACFAQVFFIDEDGNLLNRENSDVMTDEQIRKVIFIHNPLHHPTAMIRKHVGDELEWYREDLKKSEDWDFWLRILSEYKIYRLPEKLLYYRLRMYGMSRKGFFDNVKHDMRLLLHAIFDYGYPKYYLLYVPLCIVVDLLRFLQIDILLKVYHKVKKYVIH